MSNSYKLHRRIRLWWHRRRALGVLWKTGEWGRATDEEKDLIRERLAKDPFDE